MRNVLWVTLPPACTALSIAAALHVQSLSPQVLRLSGEFLTIMGVQRHEEPPREFARQLEVFMAGGTTEATAEAAA